MRARRPPAGIGLDAYGCPMTEVPARRSIADVGESLPGTGTACSVLWDASDAPAWGTATRADLIVALEQPGPWGRSAAIQSHLDPGLGAHLDAHTKELGGRFQLIRTPGRHADSPDAVASAGPRCLIARTGPAGWLVTARLYEASQLFGLTATVLEDPADTATALGGVLDPTPLLLVCTNGRRDRCCATRARPIVAALAAAWPGQVWETSHTGGHRFAPTALLLPWGRMLARLDTSLGGAILAAAAEGALPPAALGPRHDRGAMHLPAPEQAAESWLRWQAGRCDLTDPVAEAGEKVAVTVETGPEQPESCGSDPVPNVILRPHWRPGT